jgi:hypothetical protein
VTAAWRPEPTTLVLLAIVFFGNAVVVRGAARPITDAIGMACTIATLLALERQLASPTRAGALRVVALQLLGLCARAAYLPMLGMPALAAFVEPAPLATRVRRAVRAGLLLGVLPGALYFVAVRALGIEHTAWMWQVAHLPQYLPADRPRALAASLAYAGGPLLALGVLALARPSWGGQTTLRLHLAWIALYVAFLYAGGGALWLRYFAPIVPSVVVVATPALDAVVRRRRAAAIALVVLLATLHLVKVARTIGDPPPRAMPPPVTAPRDAPP